MAGTARDDYRSSEHGLELLDLLVAELGDPAIVRGRMMGRPILSRGGSMFAVLQADALGLKLGAGTPEHAAALRLPGAALFDPSGRGRPFKDWVSIPTDSSAEWPTFATDALAHITP